MSYDGMIVFFAWKLNSHPSGSTSTRYNWPKFCVWGTNYLNNLHAKSFWPSSFHSRDRRWQNFGFLRKLRHSVIFDRQKQLFLVCWPSQRKPKLNGQLILVSQKFSVKMPKKNDGYDVKNMTERTDVFVKKKFFFLRNDRFARKMRLKLLEMIVLRVKCA